MKALSTEEKKRIAAAVAEAESNTAGEIVTAIIPESDSYAAREMLYGISVGVIAFVVAALASTSLGGWLDGIFWTESTGLLPLTIGTISLVAGTLAYVLVQIPALDRFIVGRKSMETAVKNRAMRYFVESATYDTVDRTGVLLFISTLERRVELIADKGINDAVAPDTWDRIVSALIRGIKDGESTESLVSAIKEIGIVLAEHVPPRPDDENELSDGPVELGRGS